MTSYGGEEYATYEAFWNEQNMATFKEWMKRQPKVKRFLYRGYTFNRQYFEDAGFAVGKVVGMDALTQELSLPSFTTSLMRAVRYITNYGDVNISDAVRVLFLIEASARAFVDISALSVYPEEQEHKCMDNVRLKVISIKHKAGSSVQITLKEI